MLTNDQNICHAFDGLHYCSLPKDHEGPHVAQLGPGGPVLTSWSDSEEAPPPLYCYGGCGRRYDEFGLDVLLPTALWNQIAQGPPFDDAPLPENDQEGRGGVLCAQCIVDRLKRLQGVTAAFSDIVDKRRHTRAEVLAAAKDVKGNGPGEPHINVSALQEENARLLKLAEQARYDAEQYRQMAGRDFQRAETAGAEVERLTKELARVGCTRGDACACTVCSQHEWMEAAVQERDRALRTEQSRDHWQREYKTLETHIHETAVDMRKTAEQALNDLADAVLAEATCEMSPALVQLAAKAKLKEPR